MIDFIKLKRGQMVNCNFGGEAIELTEKVIFESPDFENNGRLDVYENNICAIDYTNKKLYIDYVKNGRSVCVPLPDYVHELQAIVYLLSETLIEF